MKKLIQNNNEKIAEDTLEQITLLMRNGIKDLRKQRNDLLKKAYAYLDNTEAVLRQEMQKELNQEINKINN